MKVKRQLNGDYSITHDGETYYAEKQGREFLCRGILAKLRDIKDRILAGGFPQGSGNTVPQDDPKNNTVPQGDTWDCTDPCALLILHLPYEMLRDMPSDVERTLDCYGWLDAGKEPDLARAQREFIRTRDFLSHEPKGE